MNYKSTTLTTLYCKNSTALLAELLTFARSTKTIVTYGNQTVDISPFRRVKVIHIARHGREYKGFINTYWKV